MPSVLRVGFALALLCGGAEAKAQEWRPTRIDERPTIDGVLDERLWDEVEALQDFVTYEPDYGSAMVGDTRVFMAYDDANLYFAFEAADPEPALIRASVTSRDNMFRDDWVAINLDSFGDAQSLYALYVNPLGIQGDSRLAAGTEDRGVDLVWYSAGTITEIGYTVEMQVPLQSIRFAEGDPVRMGVIFERRISRASEYGTIPALDPERAGQWANQMHPLVYPNLETPTLFEVLPALTYAVDQADQQGALATEYEQGAVSLTTKWGLTSDLVLDGTYNPDFSQVEADAGQVDVNLRSAIFYPEKRPFFLEGREHFGLAATEGLSPFRSAVYTRRIIDPLTGVRLSGKAGDDHTIASIYAVDEVDPLSDDSDYAHVPVVRYKRSLTGDGYLGGVYGGRVADDRSNHTGGVDGRIRLGQSVLLGAHVLGSRSDEDSVSTGAMTGHSIAARLSSNTRRMDWSVDLLDISEDFQSDVGFLNRAGLFQGIGMMRVRLFPEWPKFRRIDLTLVQGNTYDRPGDLWENHTRLFVANHIFGSLNLRGWVQRANEVFLGERFENDGFEVTLGGLLSNKGAFGISYGRQTQPIYSAEPYQGKSHAFNLIVGLQPSPKFDAELTFRSVDFFREATAEQVLDFKLFRLRTTLQPNRYFFLRAISEYDWYREDLLVDLLASFTYIPGTVIHVGYGTLHDRTRWATDRYVVSPDLHEKRRRLFFKTSYLFRNGS